MEVQFRHSSCSCMEPVVSRVLNHEQTQEIRLGDGMPDVGYIIGAWGQCVLRSKEWHDSFFSFSGGMMVWVLYSPEDGSQPRTVSSWIPFHLRWELPPDTPEGVISILCRCRFVDARSVAPGRIMVRSGISALGQAYIPGKLSFMTPEGDYQDIQLQVNTYPVMLLKEVGEKAFVLEEAFTPPESLPAMKELIYCCIENQNCDCRVISDKLAFRGTQQLHLVYRSESGQIHAWDFDMPYSQFAELDRVCAADAAGDISLCTTSLEPEITEDGRLHLKCGLVAQYRILEKETVCVAEDAFAISAELMTRQEEVCVPVVLDQGKITLPVEQSMSVHADVAVDARLFPDFPEWDPDAGQAEPVFSGNLQLLYYAEDGKLQSTTARWEGRNSLKLHPDTEATVIPHLAQIQPYAGSGSVLLKGDLTATYSVMAKQCIPMLTHIQTGQSKQPDPNRPSLIIRRCGEESLWELAKSSGSSVEQIRLANGLEGECVPGTLLMIPIP